MPADAKLVFKGQLFDVYQWQQELYDGSTATFEKLVRRDSATVIPVLENGKLLLVEDEQPGTARVLTFPGGQGEADEAPEEVARRELLEETGYQADELTLWNVVQPSTKVEWAVYTFIARGCTKVEEPKLDPGERITLREISFEDLLELSDDENFQNPPLAFALLKARYDEAAREDLCKVIFG